MNVAEVVGRTLASLGIGHAFGVVGSGNFHVTNALRAAGVPYVANRHEAGSATAADAFARMSGTVTLVSTHQGCGLSNAVTGIGEAAKSRTPMIVLTADSAAAAVNSNFRIDQDALAASVGAVPERVYSAESAVADTVRAYRTAKQGRRTVVLNLPLDIQTRTVEMPEVPPVASPAAVRADPASVADLARLIADAARPVFVAGRGARDAREPLRELAALSGALLATSAVANGLFHDEEWSLGISGGFSSPVAAELISEADLVVGWGCALSMWTMRHGNLIGARARVAQVDIEQAALGANRTIDLGVVGDCRLTATDVAGELAERGIASTGYRTPKVRQRIADQGRWVDVDYPDLSTSERIDPRTISRHLDAMLPAERVVSVDSGNFMGYPSAYLSVPDEFGFCFTQAFQSIGLGLATAIGAALAQPSRLPVAAVGDGGFQMSVAELDTAVRLGLGLVVIVYNDAAYGAEVHHFVDGDLDTVVFPDTDLAALARGFGCAGITVRTASDLAGLRAWLDGPRSVPIVLDVKVAGDGGSWWLAEAFRGH